MVDNQTDEVLIDEDLKPGKSVENRNAVGTFLGGATIHGAVYHGVKVWVAPRNRVYDWEPEGDAVFVQWTDKSNSRDPSMKYEKVHTVERPMPGGGVYRFNVTVG